jgi:hypothetical protein
VYLYQTVPPLGSVALIDRLLTRFAGRADR